MIKKDYSIVGCRAAIRNLEEVIQTLEEREEFEDLSMADTPKETYYKIEKLYNAMRERMGGIC